VIQSFLRLIRVFTLTASHARRIMRIKSQNLKDARSCIDQIKKDWAKASLENLGVNIKIIGAEVSEEPMLFIGNHISYLDIPLVMVSAPVSFVAKVELSQWPIIGYACRAVGTVFVKRESIESRKIAAQKIGEACLKNQQSICLFPSGTTTLTEEKPWRRGAFEIAKLHGLKIQPFRIKYKPQKVAAFIGDDAFVSHIWQLLRTKELDAEIEFHEPVEILDPQKECERWQSWCKEDLKTI